MVITRSPGLVPIPDRAFATCLERWANSRYVTSRGLPSSLTQSMARLSGSLAHLSKTSYVQLYRSGRGSSKVR